MSKSGLWRTLVLLVGLSLFATVQAHAQNGLQRFEKDIKPQLEFKSFTYDKAAPLGDKGFTLSNVVVVVPASATGGKDSTIKIEKVTVEEADFDRMKDSGKKDEVPLFAKLKIEGMTGDDELSGMLESFGIPKAPVDLALDYRLNPADKVLTVSKLEVGLQGQGSLSLSLVLDGVSDKASEAAGAKDTASLRSASLVYTDVGLLSQLLPAVAKQQGMAADAMIAMAVAPIGAFAVGQGAGHGEGAGRPRLLHRRLEEAEGTDHHLGRTGQERLAGRSRQARAAQRAHRHLRPQGRVCRHAGRRGRWRWLLGSARPPRLVRRRPTRR